MCSCNKKKSNSAPPTPSSGEGVPLRMAKSRAVAPVRAVAVAAPPPPESVDTSVWGPSLWKILHISAEFTGTPIHAKLWYSLVSAMRLGIPCDECRSHFVARSDAVPLRMSRIPGGIHTSTVRWVLNFHNFVNAATESVHGQWSEAQCRATYGGNRVARIAEAREALDAIRGVAGGLLVEALDRMLAVLDR